MAREFYRLVSYDSRDTSQVQFFTRTVNNAIYLDFTFINPVNQDWIASIEANDIIAFFQDGIDRGTAKILATYDSENGFRIEAEPSPTLNEGQYYEIRFSRPSPFPDSIPTSPENRGWSPVLALQADGERRVFRITDWVSGQGTKPQLGFIGPNGIVGDIANAIDVRGAQGESATDTITTFATNTAYPAHSILTADGTLYFTLSAIPDTNTNTIAELITAGTLVEVGKETELPDWVSDNDVLIPDTKLKIHIEDFREGRPAAPHSNAPKAEIDKAYRTIGIGNDGVLWVYELIPAVDAAATWIDFDNEHYEFEQTERLPNSALENGDFYYIYTTEEWISVSVNQQTNAVTQTVVADISEILPNHVFLGNASSEESATHLIPSGYDTRKTYLAFWGREVRQMQSFTPGSLETARWTQSTETLHNEVLRIESQINNLKSGIDALGIQQNTQQGEITQHERDISDNRKAAQRFPVTPLGNWRRDTGTGTLTAGDYQANEDTILIHKTDADGTDQETALSTIHINHAINIHNKFFIITAITGYATYSEFSGYWTKHGEDATENNAKVAIRHVPKNSRFGQWVRADDIVGLEQGNLTQATLYAELKKALKQGSNITLTYDDTNHTITVASSGGGGGNSFNILAGDGEPAANLGNDGDFYREKDNGTVWRKENGAWVEVIDLATEDELAIVRVALEALETEVTNLESEIRSVLYRTPRRVTSMPAHLEQFETIVLTEDSHGGEDVYDFVPDEATYNQSGEYYNYWGANVINFGAKLPLIGSGFPSIFRSNRLVAIYQVRTNTGTTEPQKLKVVVRTGLFNATSLTDQETKLSVRLPQYGDRLYRLRASTFDDTNAATRTIAGQSYSIYETIETFPNFAFATAAQNLNKASIQISQEISGVRQFLSDDNTTVWATGIEYTAGFYQGNASRKPIEVEIYSKDTVKNLRTEISNQTTDDDIDTSDPSQEPTDKAPSRQAVAEEIKRVEDEFAGTGSGLSQSGVDGRIDRRITDADIDTADPSTESTSNAPSRQAVAEEIKRVEGDIPDVSDYQDASEVTAIANARAKARYTDAEKTAVSNIPSNSDITNIADARAKARYTDAEKTKVGTVESNAKDDQTAGEVPVTASGFSGNLSNSDNTVQKALDTLDGLSVSGGGGITAEENRFERLVADPAATTNIRFRVADQAGLPTIDNFPRRQGTSWEIDYRQVAGKLIVFEPNTSANTTFEINLQDLIGIRTELIGTDLDGTVFLFANKSDKTGSFTANPAIAQVFPAGLTLAAESLALITINSIGANGPSQTYELLVQPLGGGDGEADKEILYGSGAPAGGLGVIGDSYVNLTNGAFYVKTGSSSWTQRIDFATQAELNAKVTDTDISILSPSGESTSVAPSRQSVAEMGENLKEAADNAKSAADAAKLTADAAVPYDNSWSAGTYKQGTIVLHGGQEYIARAAVVSSDPAPNHATNTKWVQISNADDSGGGATPRRVTTLPTSPYTIGDTVYLTATDGSNAPGLYTVFDTAKGYEPAEINRKPLVLLTWDETRSYADVTLPINYTDYRMIRLIGHRGTNELTDLVFPTIALQDSNRDVSGNDGVLGENNSEGIRFNRTSRVISRRTSTSAGILRFVYGELYS